MNHTPNTEQRERELFELAMRKNGCDDRDFELSTHTRGAYTWRETQKCWNTWKAARATQAAPASPEPAEMSNETILKLVCDHTGKRVSLNTTECAEHIEFARAVIREIRATDRAPASPNTGAVAWAVTAPKGGIHKLSITRESAERKKARWLEEWPDNKCEVRPLVFGDVRPVMQARPSAGCECGQTHEWCTANDCPDLSAAISSFATPSPSKGGEAAPADPCPQCQPGGVCKTPTCGRLRSSELMALYGTGKGGEADSAAEDNTGKES